MLGKMQLWVSQRVMRAGLRGNSLAQWALRRETQKLLAGMPEPSPLVRGAFSTADPDRPLPEDQQGGLLGDFEWMPLPRRSVGPGDLRGCRVSDVSFVLGSYGMGGHGFFGLDLGAEWLVVPLHVAGAWVALDGRIAEDPHQTVPTWIIDADDRDLRARLIGAVIERAVIERHTMAIDFDNGATLTIAEDPADRPVFQGTGKPRRFLPDDDLAAEVFLTTTPEIYT